MKPSHHLVKTAMMKIGSGSYNRTALLLEHFKVKQRHVTFTPSFEHTHIPGGAC